jgi:hypothetical protein
MKSASAVTVFVRVQSIGLTERGKGDFLPFLISFFVEAIIGQTSKASSLLFFDEGFLHDEPIFWSVTLLIGLFG